jgi:hypothetical protein
MARRAVASPMPVVLPVTRMTLSLRRIGKQRGKDFCPASPFSS